MLAADSCEALQRVDRPGVRGARGGHDRQRPAAGVGVRADRRRDGLRLEALIGVGRKDADLIGPEPEHACGARDRSMSLIGDVQRRALVHRPEQRLARAREGGEVGSRAAGHEHAGGLARVADPLLEPVEDDELDAARAGALHPGADVDAER